MKTAIADMDTAGIDTEPDREEVDAMIQVIEAGKRADEQAARKAAATMRERLQVSAEQQQRERERARAYIESGAPTTVPARATKTRG